MKIQTRSFLVRSTAAALLMMAGGVSRLNSMVPPDSLAGRAAPAMRKAAAAMRRKPAPRISADECSALALKATIAKARLEMRTLLPGSSADPADIGTAMASDRRLSRKIKLAFGNSDLIRSEYSKSGECVVTLKLPLDKLQLLARGL